MNDAPAKIQFVKSLFASKIFWTQMVTLAAMIASAAGWHLLDTPGQQEQLIGTLDAIATVALRLWFPTGPVSITGPVSVPAPVDVPVGASVVSVPTPAAIELQQTAIVQPLSDNIHTVDATTEIPIVKNPR
jgi:hypothetical protein